MRKTALVPQMHSVSRGMSVMIPLKTVTFLLDEDADDDDDVDFDVRRSSFWRKCTKTLRVWGWSAVRTCSIKLPVLACCA